MPIYVNQSPIQSFQFSAGECQIKLPSLNIDEKTIIKAFIQNSNDIMCLLLTVDAVRRIRPETKIHLIIPYMPYARQDRVCVEGEALSMAVMAQLINQLNSETVTIWDPHSDVAAALIKHVKIRTIQDFIQGSELETLIVKEQWTLISPDAGAEKKVRNLAKVLSSNSYKVPMLTATKVRDTLTGEILATHIDNIEQGKSYLIVDDICDGGRTFIELAKKMKVHGADKIFLYVTHGIFSKGLDPLFEFIDGIFCVNSWLNVNEEKFTILEV